MAPFKSINGNRSRQRPPVCVCVQCVNVRRRCFVCFLFSGIHAKNIFSLVVVNDDIVTGHRHHPNASPPPEGRKSLCVCVCVCVLGGGQAGRHNNINDRAQTKGETAIFFYKKTPTIGQKCTPSQLTKKSRKTRENPDEPGGKTRKENHVQSAKTNKNSRQTRFLAGFFFRYEQDA